MDYEQRDMQQVLGIRKRAGAFQGEGIQTRLGWRYDWRAVNVADAKIPAAKHGSGSGEHIRMACSDRPGAVTAHRFASQVDAIGIDREAALCLVETAHHVAIAHPQILGIA